MKHDQAAADRERIAGEMLKQGIIHLWPTGDKLGAAVRAFEVLCEPRGYRWMRDAEGDWYGFQPKGMRESVCVSPTGSHAADVCRLVCEVLDREAKG